MHRFAALAVAAVVAAAIAGSAHAALFFLFAPRSAEAGQLVAVRLGGTPAGFTRADREKPFGRPMRIYLVPNGVAGEVTSRFDPRLHFVGLLVPDRNGRGVLNFRAPPLDTASYVVAVWCPGCAGASFGETFFVLDPTRLSLARFPALLLRLRLPDPRDTCPATTGTATACSRPGARRMAPIEDIASPTGRSSTSLDGCPAAGPPGSFVSAASAWTARASSAYSQFVPIPRAGARR